MAFAVRRIEMNEVFWFFFSKKNPSSRIFCLKNFTTPSTCE